MALLNLLEDSRRFQLPAGQTEEERAKLAQMELRQANNAFILERAEAEAGYREAIRQYEKLVEDFPPGTSYRKDLARAHFNLGTLLQTLGTHKEAEAAYHRAIGLHEQLVAEFKADPDYRRDLADDYNNLGTLLRDQEEWTKAEKVFRQAITIGEELIREFKDVPGFRINLAMGYVNLGNTVRDQRQAKAALAWYEKAVEQMAAIDPPSDDSYRVLRTAHWDRANALGQLGQHAEAIRNWQQAIAAEAVPVRDHLRLFLAAEQVEEKLTTEVKPTGPFLYEAARLNVQARASTFTTDDPSLRARYAKRALDLLKQAGAAGYFRDPERIKQLKEDLASLPAEVVKPFLDSLDGKKEIPGKK